MVISYLLIHSTCVVGARDSPYSYVSQKVMIVYRDDWSEGHVNSCHCLPNRDVRLMTHPLEVPPPPYKIHGPPDFTM